VYGNFKRKDVGVVMDIVLKAREIVREASIYRGRAIQLVLDEEYNVNSSAPPKFIPDLESARLEELVLNDIEEKQIDASLWTPIRKADACRKNKIPLKRGILLEGRYGIGKSMTARMTAKICEENGWTFIMLPDVRGLRGALEFARRYAPAVVFAEDIDRAIAQRDDLGNDLINVIDGVVGKGDEVITVLTTNYVEKLDRAMLRPGRLDAVIRIKTPDVSSAERLIKTYARDTLAKKANIRAIAKQLSEAQAIPATIREVVERSKLTMLSQERVEISEDDLVVAATSMIEHLELLNEKPNQKSKAEQLGEIVLATFGGQLDKVEVIEARLEHLINLHE